MFKKIYKEIKKYNNIVIARHIGVDPDALASQLALKESIKLTFPKKSVYAVGNGSTKFSYMGHLDKLEEFDNILLIVLDTPDKKRIDFKDYSKASMVIKIDHHPFIEDFGGLEYIDDSASSTCEILMGLILETKLKCNEKIAKLRDDASEDKSKVSEQAKAEKEEVRTSASLKKKRITEDTKEERADNSANAKSEREKVSTELKAAVTAAREAYKAAKENLDATYEDLYQQEFDKIASEYKAVKKRKRRK